LASIFQVLLSENLKSVPKLFEESLQDFADFYLSNDLNGGAIELDLNTSDRQKV